MRDHTPVMRKCRCVRVVLIASVAASLRRVVLVASVAALQPTRRHTQRRGHDRQRATLEEFDEFDVVEYARNATGPVELGVIRDRRVQPLCCWQEADPVELVWDVDEEPLESVYDVLNAVDFFLQQRLVDCGLGPAGTSESEDVYFVDRGALAPDTIVTLREDREVWW